MIKLSKSEIEDYLPELLVELPIVDVARSIDFSKNFIVTTPTASGKTIAIPFLDAMLYPDKRIFLRQPSRLAVHSLYSAYKMFFKDRLEVGIMTSTLKENTDAPIVLVSDGILANIFRRKSELQNIIVIEDEAHSLIGQTEIELALIKQEVKKREKEGIEEPFVRVLTATIDPTQISDYLNIDKEDTHILSKSNFNAEKFIIDASKVDFDDVLRGFIKRLNDNNRNGIVFVPTRAETQNYQNEYEKSIKTEFIHAGESPDKLEQIMKGNRENPEPLMVFSTVAGATSITANFDDALIFDEKISGRMKEGVEHIIRVPCDSNLLIQMKGRIARFKEGNVYLYTKIHKSWDEIKPTSVDLPLERTTPYDLSLIMAQYGVSDIKELELMSKIDVNELKHAMDFLKGKSVIENYNGSIQLTKLGKVVQKLPLDVKMSIIFANSNPEMMPIFAAAFSSGYSNVWNFMSNVKTNDGWKKAPLNDKYYNGKSEFISKAKVIQEAFKIRSKGRGELSKWCGAYKFDYRYIGNVLGSFSSIENSMQKKLRDNLIDIDIDKISNEFVNNIIESDVLPIISFKRARSGSLVGFHDGVYTILSSETERILYLDDTDYVTVSGNLVQIRSKRGNDIKIMSCGTVIE